jgi:hypothetical protein
MEYCAMRTKGFCPPAQFPLKLQSRTQLVFDSVFIDILYGLIYVPVGQHCLSRRALWC